MLRRVHLVLVAALAACSFDPPRAVDAPATDAGNGTTTRDAGPVLLRDGGEDPRDGGTDLRDAGEDPRDGGEDPRDGGGGPRDGGGGPRDGGPQVDGGGPDAGVRDGGVPPLTCGNGQLDGNEACDDGNRAVMDGCDRFCRVEAGYTCVAEPSECRLTSDISFVDAANNCPGSGMLNDPYCDVAAGIAAGTPVVVVRGGTYTQDQTISNQAVEIIGTGNVVMAPTGSKLFVISGQSDVTLRHLDLRGTSNDIIDLGNSSRARLFDVDVGDGSQHGIHTKNSSRLEMNRCVVHDLSGDPLLIDSTGGFLIVNTIIRDNSAAGVTVQRPPANSAIINSTIVGNSDEGVDCGDEAVSIVNTIVFANGGTSGVTANCVPEYCFLQTSGSGTTNITAAAPGFDGNFRLQPGSPCIDAGDDTRAPPRDIDRQRRTQADIGADER